MNADHVCRYYAYQGMAYLDRKMVDWSQPRKVRAVLCDTQAVMAYSAIGIAMAIGDPEKVKAAMRAYWSAVLAVEKPHDL